MTFRGEVHHRARTMGRQDALQERAIGDVAADESVARAPLDLGEAREVAGVGELVEVAERLVAMREPVEHEVRTDEAGAARHQDRHRAARLSAISFAYLTKLFVQPMRMCTSPATPSRKPSRKT